MTSEMSSVSEIGKRMFEVINLKKPKELLCFPIFVCAKFITLNILLPISLTLNISNVICNFTWCCNLLCKSRKYIDSIRMRSWVKQLCSKILTGLQYLSGQNVLYYLSVKIFVEKGSKEGRYFRGQILWPNLKIWTWKGINVVKM